MMATVNTSRNQYEALMSEAADKLAELQDQKRELVAALKIARGYVAGNKNLLHAAEYGAGDNSTHLAMINNALAKAGEK